MNNSKSKGLKVKDIVTVTLLTLVNIVVYSVLGLLCYAVPPLTVAIYPIVIALVQGVVYFVIGAKVKKPFAFLIYSVVMGISGFNIPYIACFVAGGIIAELILKITGYGKSKGIALSYIIIQLLAAFGSTIYPYWLANETTYISANGVDTNAQTLQLFQSARNFFSVSVSIGVLVATIVAATIGAVIGNLIMKKHLNNQEEKGDELGE